MKELIARLSKYGEVKTCKLITKDAFNVVMTKGFSDNGNEVFKFLKECVDEFPEHTRMETCITEKDFCVIVLIKP